MEVLEREFDRRGKPLEQGQVGVLLRFEIVEGDAIEIGDDEPARDFLGAAGIHQAANVPQTLGMRLVQVLAGGLVLDEDAARPEDVDVAPIAGEFFDGFLEG
ncbi:MAG: hypothetical protein WCP35_17795 [Verrucomicrobiota bacterium]